MNEQENQYNPDIKEESVDYKAMFLKFFRFWYFFMISIILALTGTENAEIAKRHRYMKKFDITEAEAAFKVADEILLKRQQFGTSLNG